MAEPDAALREILALADYARGPVAADVFMLVADYLAEGRALPGEPDYHAALALLRQLRPQVSAACKARLATRLHGPASGRVDLLLLLLDDAEALWAPLLATIRLDEAEWHDLAAHAPPAARARIALRRREAAPAGLEDTSPAEARQEVFRPFRPVAAVVGALGPQAGQRGISLNGETEPGLGPVVGDPRGLEEALLRLAGLACEAARAGDRLVLGARPAGGGGLAYALTRPAGLDVPRITALRPVERLAERLGGQLVATESQLVLYLRLPPARPPRLVWTNRRGRAKQ